MSHSLANSVVNTSKNKYCVVFQYIFKRNRRFQNYLDNAVFIITSQEGWGKRGSSHALGITLLGAVARFLVVCNFFNIRMRVLHILFLKMFLQWSVGWRHVT